MCKSLFLSIGFIFVSMNNPEVIYVNTSNPGKMEEYKEYFSPKTVEFKTEDLTEPQADPLTIIQYKASCFQEVLVDDVALDIDGVDIGVNIRWFLDQLHSSKYLGRSCIFSCLLAVRIENEIRVYKGSVQGTLVEPRGDGFGFGPYFLPDGADKTLGEFMDPRFNARYIAIENFKMGKIYKILPILEKWDGDIQKAL